jgi:hypothetical protein
MRSLLAAVRLSELSARTMLSPKTSNQASRPQLPLSATLLSPSPHACSSYGVACHGKGGSGRPASQSAALGSAHPVFAVIPSSRSVSPAGAWHGMQARRLRRVALPAVVVRSVVLALLVGGWVLHGGGVAGQPAPAQQRAKAVLDGRLEQRVRARRLIPRAREAQHAAWDAACRKAQGRGQVRGCWERPRRSRAESGSARSRCRGAAGLPSLLPPTCGRLHVLCNCHAAVVLGVEATRSD